VRSRMTRWCLCVLAAALVGPTVALADLGPRVDGCGDVRFIGVKGSGETGMADDYGREMATLSAEIQLALPDWVEFKSTQVNYPAYSIDLLTHGLVAHYADGVEQGDQALRVLMDDIEEVCPNELEVLGGYSSGAMVVHDILDELALSDHWAASHIIGVHLLADPRRTPTDPTTRGGAGSATFGIAAIGEWVSILHGTGEVPSVFGPVTRSWCAPRDPVCALVIVDLHPVVFVANMLVNGWRHSSYGGAILPNLFADEAQRLTRRVRYQFPPTSQVLDTVATGWPVNFDLKGDFSHGVRFTAISPAIPGLKLTSDGHLSGVVPSIGFYQAEVTAVAGEGGTSKFTVFLNVVEPFNMVDFDPDPVVLAPMPVHEPTGVTVPGIPPRSVVTLEPTDTMPAGLTLSSAAKIQGRPDIVGDFSVGVRVAKTDGTLRRFRLSGQVVNPAKLVTATADGTPSDSSVSEGVVLDDSHVAFASAASNLGVENPNGDGIAYVKNVDTGALGHWAPPPNEFLCALQTDAAKANLYIATTWWRDFTNDNGDPDSEEYATIRRLPVAGQPDSTGQLAPSTVTSFAGSCNAGASIAAATALGTAVISANRLDLPGQPLGAGDSPARLYTLGVNGFTVVANPRSDGLAWSPVSIVDVRSDGVLLVREQRTVNTGDPGASATETGYFLLSANGAWRRVDLNAASQPIKMLSPRFYAGGIVFSLNRNDVQASVARAAAALVIGDSGVLRFKAIGFEDPVAFDSVGIDSTRGIQPLTTNDYAVGCHTYKRSKPTRVEPTTVYFDGSQIGSCIASAPGNAPSPFPAGGPTRMLVSGSVNDGQQQLLIAAVP